LDAPLILSAYKMELGIFSLERGDAVESYRPWVNGWAGVGWDENIVCVEADATYAIKRKEVGSLMDWARLVNTVCPY
jgi:hypothetical protein